MGSFKIQNLPPGKAGSVSFAVTFCLNEDGILEATAVESSSGVNNKLIVNVDNFHLCENQIVTILTDAENHKNDDDVYERFVSYESQTRKYGNNIIHEIDKLDNPAKIMFISVKWYDYIKAVHKLPYTEITTMKEKFEAIRKDIEPLIDGVISVKKYLRRNCFLTEDDIVNLLDSTTPLTLDDLEKLINRI